MVFNAITKPAVTEAMQNPREVDGTSSRPISRAARSTTSWGSTSRPCSGASCRARNRPGRVQSVCLRLIVEREMEIEAFRPREYWSVKAQLATPRGQEFEARLVTLGGKKLDKYDLEDATQAEMAVQAIESAS